MTYMYVGCLSQPSRSHSTVLPLLQQLPDCRIRGRDGDHTSPYLTPHAHLWTWSPVASRIPSVTATDLWEKLAISNSFQPTATNTSNMHTVTEHDNQYTHHDMNNASLRAPTVVCGALVALALSTPLTLRTDCLRPQTRTLHTEPPMDILLPF